MAEVEKTVKPKKATKTDITYYEGVGRRKSAVARVRAYSVKKGVATVGATSYKAGTFLVNGKSIEKVFGGKSDQIDCMRPLRVTDSMELYVVSAKTIGGGISGQVDAISHGLARALVNIPSADLKTKLRADNLLTRDSRVRERRKVGTGGKARRVKQSPKR